MMAILIVPATTLTHALPTVVRPLICRHVLDGTQQRLFKLLL